jgi:transcriptional regulator with XRE-family HTH domain
MNTSLMRDPIEYLGPRLKEIRAKTGISLREVARQLDVSPSFLSQIENGKSQPSVANLYAIAKLLGVSVDVLFEAKGTDASSRLNAGLNIEIDRGAFAHPADAWDQSRARISSVNPNNRSVIVMESGVHWERLAATSEPNVNFMEIIYEPGSETNKSSEMIFHDGFEYGYALEGELEMTIGDLILPLPAGHSVGFDSSIPHRFRNIGNTPFQGIWFVHGCSVQH